MKSKSKFFKTLSDPSYQSYVPVANTLVEEDSPWNIDDQEEEEEIIPSVRIDVLCDRFSSFIVTIDFKFHFDL